MNHATRFTKLALLLIVAGALALAGCGGDDGVDQSVHDMALAAATDAQAEADAAKAAAAEEEAARMAAEAEAAQAAADKAAAEAAEAAALALQMEAEEDQAAAEAKAAAAEAAAQMAQDAAAEAAMTAKEAADLLAEVREDLAAAEQARMEAEMGQTEAEMGQTAAEMERDALAAADMAARAAGIMSGMRNFIADTPADNAARDISTPADYVPGTAAAGTADATLYDDEAVPGNTPPLPADVSAGDRMRPSVDGAPGLGGVSVKHTEADGIMATVTAPRGLEFTVVGYEKQDTMAPAIEGWDNQVLMRRNDADSADQLLYFYTDIAQDSGVSFLSRYQGTTVVVTPANIGLASSPSFPTSANPARQFPAAVDGAIPFAGTFDGVPGTFQCTAATGSTCAVNWNAADGTLGFAAAVPAFDGTGALTTGLTFVPADPTASVTAGSGDYLYFGYWLHKPDAPGGNHPFITFAGGMQPFVTRGDNPTTPAVERDVANIAAPERDQISLVHQLTGTARFKGPAAGKYVTRSALTAGANIGQFTATAELLADFDALSPLSATGMATTGQALTTAADGITGGTGAGTADSTPQAPGMINGIVRDFRDMNGDALSNWRVTLGAADLLPIGADPSLNEGADRTAGTADDSFNGKTGSLVADGLSTTRFVGTTSARVGGGVITSINGTWSGQFYGNGRADGNPNAIVGVFDAHADHASISGAFGSYNTDQ